MTLRMVHVLSPQKVTKHTLSRHNLKQPLNRDIMGRAKVISSTASKKSINTCAPRKILHRTPNSPHMYGFKSQHNTHQGYAMVQTEQATFVPFCR
ncbi:hypothetical protein QL285_002339 [Trifolium repens]|nr:hypothetical protein QL285_002339 [Trifolium repens]